ncbi:hypothetical protein [Mycobacterium sp.]|uniref:hypothetical protein n=1 Tax=Mycobacterium sp. TaxID=1785 RepID=UPI002D05B963|nr:hypothetical protein [Mycobacterium sp.]HKP43160.1 hypothetical protein [Mycobacterium sp.]
MLGHLGINVPDLPVAKDYYGAVMPLVAFEHEPRVFPQYPQPYFATFWLDPWGFMLEAVCHHDRE